MWDILFDLLVGTLVVATVAVVIYNWDDIRESVARWLRNNGLSESALMRAWIGFDRVASNIRVRIFGKTQKTGVQEIKETQVSPEQLKKEDPDVYAELQRRGYAEMDITSQVT